MPRSGGNSFDLTAETPRSSARLASFADRLEARRRELPVAMQRIVALIEADPHAFTEGTITSLAARAGVAASTVTRLSRALGYASVSRMRVAVAREQVAPGSAGSAGFTEVWNHDVGEDLRPEDDPQALLEKLTFAHLRMIRATAAQIDVGLLQALAERIARADRVELFAIGGSANAAQMFTERVFRIGVQPRVWSEVHAGLVAASFLGPSSVAIAVSRSGRTPEVAQLLREAGRRGAHTVAVVGSPSSRIGSLADVVIPTAAAEHPGSGDLTPRHGQGFVLDLLYLLLARLDVEATTRRLATTGRSVERHRRDLEGGEDDHASDATRRPT